MNLTEFLLKENVNIIDKLGERSSKQIEIPRLSELFNTKFEFTIKNLTTKEMEDARKESSQMVSGKKGITIDMDTAKYNLALVRLGTFSEDGKRFFSNEDLLKKFKAATPDDFIRKLLRSGEIDKLSGEISELSGYDDNAIKPVKV